MSGKGFRGGNVLAEDQIVPWHLHSSLPPLSPLHLLLLFLITMLDDNIQPRRLLPENQSVMSLWLPSLFLLTLMNRKLALLRMVALMRIELLMSKPFDVEAVGVFWWGVRMLFMCITTDMECRKKPHILSVYEQWSRTCPWVTLILYSDLMWFWPCIVVNMWK